MNESTLKKAKRTFLTEEGLCRRCQKWLELAPGKDWLPTHKHKGKRCKNSHYSPDDNRYRVKTHKQALQLANMLAKDEGDCLSGIGSGAHNMSCGNGVDCNIERRLLAKALANFMLKSNK